MAANPFFLYGPALEAVADGVIDLDTDAFRMILVGTGYTPNQSTDALYSDVSANEISGTGYTAGGKLITQSVTRSGLIVTFDCDNQSWASSTLTNVAYAALVRDANGDGSLAAGDLLLCAAELEAGGSLSTVNGTLAVNINDNGVFAITAATAA